MDMVESALVVVVKFALPFLLPQGPERVQKTQTQGANNNT